MPSVPLYPLSSEKEREIPGFGVCDIEARDWINFLVIGYAFKTYAKDSEVETDRQYHYFCNLSEFCDFIFDNTLNPHNLIFAHFGGKYDFSFILRELFFSHEKYYIHTIIPRGSGLLSFKVSLIERVKEVPKGTRDDDILHQTKDGYWLIAKRTIDFKDSSAFLPFGLASLTENFGVDHKKQEIDYEKITEVTPELLEYLEYDCWGLYECIERYFRWPLIKRSGPAFTIASQSLKVFRTFMDSPIPSLPDDVDAFVRSSYFGGRTEIFKPFFEQKEDDGMLRSYDVNSLYPFIMRELSFPGKYHKETMFYMENRMGFYDVEVTVPEMYVPPLGLRYEGMEDRLIFPTGTFRGVWSSLELNYAMSLGVKINRIYRGMLFHDYGQIFKEYIDVLYDMRKKSKRDSVDNVLTKLLMNSTYGRFGLNLDREQLEFDYGQHGLTPHMEIETGNQSLIRLGKVDVRLDTSFSNVAIAAWVTSGARTHMHKLYSQAPEDLYYTDTDSLKTTFAYQQNDADLGQLKLEYKVKRAAFILPKTYMEDTTSPIFKLFDEQGKVRKDVKSAKKIVMKGFDKRKIAAFKFEDFTSALEGDMRRLQATNPKKFATLRTAVKKNEFLALLDETPRQIRTRYNKRLVYKRPWSQVYDTKPLHIKNGEIVNMDKDILKKWKPPSDEELDAIMDRALKRMGAM